MPFAPTLQRATALKSGDVVVIGHPRQAARAPATASAALYDADTGTWASAEAGPVTATSVFGPLILLKDGKVLALASKGSYLYTPLGLGDGGIWWPRAGAVLAAALVLALLLMLVVRRRGSRRGARRTAPAGGGFAS